ncbi:MAG: hypothetical protein HUU43_04865 [Ignavibacteriaceae bacterium]|nr:hypothetical protein [Ignavibacteriaceae bacterium]NUM70155.1 hypothetical protein [Ignavibacteriaceae bacterium]
MVRRFRFLLSAVVLFCFSASAQTGEIKEAFVNFEYGRAIEIWELNGKNLNLPSGEKKDLLMIIGASYYSLGDLINASKSFSEIIAADTSYSPDQSFYSPKIIGFYSEIKETYLIGFRNAGSGEGVIKKDTLQVMPEPVIIRSEFKYSPSLIQNAVLTNLLLPGSGHYLTSGLTARSLLYDSLSLITLTASVYFTVQTDRLKNEYLSENNTELISSRYDDYNSAYKMRNLSYILFALNWAISQADLHLFSDLYSVITYDSKRDLISYNISLRF